MIFDLKLYLKDIVDFCSSSYVTFNTRKTQLSSAFFFLQLTVVQLMLKRTVVVEEKLLFKILGLSFTSTLDLVSQSHSMKFLSLDFVLRFFKSTIQPRMECYCQAYGYGSVNAALFIENKNLC